VVIPCLDSELANFIEIAPFLRDRGIAAILPSPDALGKRAKEKLGEFCEGNHIPCPRTVTGFDIETLLRAAEDLGYPLFIKGRLYEGKLVHDRAELSSFAGELFEKWGGPVLAQRAIVGEEYCYTGFASPRSEIVGHCSIRKMLVTKAGKGFAGVVIADGDLDRLAARIVRRLGWSGPFELEFIRPPKGRHMLIEVNPRFPAWIDFPSQVGCNLPALLLDRACNLPREEKLSCPPGKLFIRHSIDLAGDIGDLAHMATTGVRLAPKSIGLLEAFK
jgi:carbamoyl-phosphate synthase large subunit